MESTGQVLGIVLGLLWGIGYAVLLQWLPVGRYIVARVTWLAVIVGVGVDLLIAGPFIGWPVVIFVGAIIAASSVGVIARSLLNDHAEHVAFERSLELDDER